jgi:hypothetical protein
MRRLAILPAAALAAVALLAGCGGDSSSSSDLADLAPPKSVLYVEGAVRPSGELKANVDAIAQQVAGVDDLGELIVEELESSSEEEGEPVDYGKEIEPWLGDRASVAFQRLEDGDLSGMIMVAQSTDAETAQRFVDDQVGTSDAPYEDASYEGVDYKFGGADENAIGIVDDFVLLAEGEQDFKAAVDAADGESLADEAGFERAISAASQGSLADVYVDVGGLIDQSGDEIDPAAREALQSAGIDPSEATAVASLLPGNDQVEVQFSSDLGGEQAPTGDASELLGSLPSTSFAAIAASGFGEQLQEVVDTLDEEGIPGSVPPNQLKKGLKQFGIDLDALTGSLQDLAVFAVGNSESRLGGALVLTTEGSEATDAISSLGQLLRGQGVPGITALSGRAGGFSIRDEELGEKPLVVAAEGQRIAIGYGLPATLAALSVGSGKTLSDNPAYADAVAALGKTPIGGFADGRAALRLADSLVPASESGFEKAKRYLRSIEFLAFGSASEDELATAKLIIGLK